jgi:hypothetical protein
MHSPLLMADDLWTPYRLPGCRQPSGSALLSDAAGNDDGHGRRRCAIVRVLRTAALKERRSVSPLHLTALQRTRSVDSLLGIRRHASRELGADPRRGTDRPPRWSSLALARMVLRVCVRLSDPCLCRATARDLSTTCGRLRASRGSRTASGLVWIWAELALAADISGGLLCIGRRNVRSSAEPAPWHWSRWRRYRSSRP